MTNQEKKLQQVSNRFINRRYSEAGFQSNHKPY